MDGKPFRVEDSTRDEVPRRLSTLINTLDVRTAEQTFAILLHVMMLELGFVPLASNDFDGSVSTESSENEPCSKPRDLPPADWITPGPNSAFLFSYKANNYEGLECNLLLRVVGPAIGVMGIDRTTNETFTLSSVRIVDYINTYDAQDPLPRRFQGLRELSRVFKETVAIPLLVSVLNNRDLRAPFLLQELPDETILKIFGHLDAVDLINAGTTCKKLSEISKEPLLWTNLLLKDFDHREQGSECLKKVYKRKMLAEKERKRIPQRYLPQNYPEYQPRFHPPPPHPWLPGEPPNIFPHLHPFHYHPA